MIKSDPKSHTSGASQKQKRGMMNKVGYGSVRLGRWVSSPPVKNCSSCETQANSPTGPLSLHPRDAVGSVPILWLTRDQSLDLEARVCLSRCRPFCRYLWESGLCKFVTWWVCGDRRCYHNHPNYLALTRLRLMSRFATLYPGCSCRRDVIVTGQMQDSCGICSTCTYRWTVRKGWAVCSA